MAAQFPNNTKTWTSLIDNVSLAQADNVNTLYDEVTAIETKLKEGDDDQVLSISSGVPTWVDPSVGGNTGINEETLTGDKTLTTSDNLYQALNTNNSNRTVNLPTGNSDCYIFFIKNTAYAYQDKILYVKYSSATISQLRTGSQYATFIWNGATWVQGNNATDNIVMGTLAAVREKGVAIGYNASSLCSYQDRGGVAIGYNASAYDAWDPGVAIGRLANGAGSGGGYDCGTAIGASSNGSNSGIAIGYYADGANEGIAIGWKADTNTKNFAIAKGYYSKCERWNEEWKCSDGVSTNKYGNGVLNWHGETTDATPTEIFLGGTSNQRATVIANSAYMFDINLIAYCNGSTKGKTIKLQGGIRRDGSNNTTLIGSVSNTTISEDGTTNYTVSVTADDSNEALIITVTGVAAETVRWNATGYISECRF